ncbi:MAG: hypothetical protein ACK4IX_16035 [Candidatus Sericytochromatia bacterium]
MENIKEQKDLNLKKEGYSNHKEWRNALLQDPLKHGWNGILLALTTLIVTGVFGILGLSLFPNGSYPKIVLALPGLITGISYFFLVSKFFYKLKYK